MTSKDSEGRSAAEAPTDSPASSPSNSPQVSWWRREPLSVPAKGGWSRLSVIGIVALAIVIAWAILAIQYQPGEQVVWLTVFQTFILAFVSVLLAALSFAKFEYRGQQISASIFTLLVLLISTGFLLP